MSKTCAGCGAPLGDDDRFCRICGKAAALSARETEVLSLALRGRTNERIAQELFIAKSTADTHLRRIYSKCGVHSRQELLDLAEKTAASLRSRE